VFVWGRRGESLAAPFVYPYMIYIMTDIQDIILTPNAAHRVAEIAEKLGKSSVLRLSVEGGGCSGFQYKFELADSIEADDVIADATCAKLVVDPISLDLVRGSAVDFVESLGGKSFQVTNPNAASGCGCGSSFSV
jgi:iron-sulfur cluster insertion protein